MAPHIRQYDTLIVGAGAAGAVLATRLSEDPARSVCLVEAGPDYLRIDDLPPRVRGFDFSDRTYAGAPLESHEWRYTARATARQAQIPVPRGRVIGGSSSINGCVFLRALRADLDGWAAAGNTDWAFDRCLPYFRKLEADCDFAQDEHLHGARGPIPVWRAAREDWQEPSRAFFDACRSMGYADCADMNQPDARGVGPIPLNFRNGIRYSSAIGYLIPGRFRPNLDVVCDTSATRVRIAGHRATAVEVERDGRLEEIAADEIILSAGSIGSPHLLMLSGVGPADDLKRIGIAPVFDLPGVGRHVRDHPFVSTLWTTSEPVASTPVIGLPWQMQLRATAPASDILDDAWLTMILSTLSDADDGHRFTIPCSLMYERSVGSLRLASADSSVAPTVDFDYLSDPSDLRRLRDLTRLAIEIGNQPAFGRLQPQLREPSPVDLASDSALEDWVARTVSTGHHISCTCRMGPATDPAAVVDAQGRVHGCENLRVIDASILPECPGVNLNATVMMMAEKLAAESFS